MANMFWFFFNFPLSARTHDIRRYRRRRRFQPVSEYVGEDSNDVGTH